jgi:hypothetical protein
MGKPRAAEPHPNVGANWRPSTPYRLVVVEWEDSQRPQPPWIWLDEYALPDAVRCLSVGFLVAETSEALALAPNLGDMDRQRAQACGIIRIPTSAVRRMADL